MVKVYKTLILTISIIFITGTKPVFSDKENNLVRYKDHTNEQYQAFLSQEFNSNFGLTDDQILDWFFNSAGAQAVIQSYGVDRNFITSRLFPELDRRNLGHFMFLAITSREGGGAGNWINHYMTDTSTDGFQCAKDDMDYIETCLTTGYTLCTSAPECIKPWVEDNPGEAQKFYASAKQTSIAGYYMAATFAGNAWVWATNWCEANQGSSAPAIYFGNPYDDIMNFISSLGKDFGNGGGSGNKPNPKPKPDKNPSKPKPTEKPQKVAPTLSKAPIKKTGRTTKTQLKTGIAFQETAGFYIPRFAMSEKHQESGDKQNQQQKPKPKPDHKPTQPPAGGNLDVWNYISSLMGGNVGSGQCYALAQAVTLQFGGNPLVGFPNAKDIWHDYAWGTGNLSLFESKPVSDQNGSELARGDILCLEATGDNGGWHLNYTYGHVVIVSKVAGGQVEWVDQNATGQLDPITLRPISFTQNFPYRMTGFIRKVK